MMNVVAVQLDIVWENKAENFGRARQLLTAARPEKGSLVVLPEMFATGFSMNTATVAEPYGGETEQFLARAASEFGCFVVGGVAMRGLDGQARNKALVFSPAGELISYYAKMRPFTPGGELDHYQPGKKIAVFEWQECKVSPFICYDLRFPEIFRESALRHRPELFVVIASWPDKRIQHWSALLQARAIENQAYVLGVNRVGRDPFYTYCGRSLLVNPHGEIVFDAGSAETVAQSKLDLENLRKYRQGLPFLEDLQSREPVMD